MLVVNLEGDCATECEASSCGASQSLGTGIGAQAGCCVFCCRAHRHFVLKDMQQHGGFRRRGLSAGIASWAANMQLCLLVILSEWLWAGGQQIQGLMLGLEEFKIKANPLSAVRVRGFATEFAEAPRWINVTEDATTWTLSGTASNRWTKYLSCTVSWLTSQPFHSQAPTQGT